MLLSHEMIEGRQLGGGSTLRRVKCPSLDSTGLTAPSNPPAFQMPLLISLSQSSKISMRSHSARPCHSWVPVPKPINLLSYHSPLCHLRGMCVPLESRTSAQPPAPFDPTGITGPVHGGRREEDSMQEFASQWEPLNKYAEP